MKLYKLWLVLLLVVALSVQAWRQSTDAPPEITPQARRHILYGDSRGGGHLYGTGRPCKSEFPKAWNADKVLAEAVHLAANDNYPLRREENGYYVRDGVADGVKMRVVLNGQKTKIVTAYPIDAGRNACTTKDR